MFFSLFQMARHRIREGNVFCFSFPFVYTISHGAGMVPLNLYNQPPALIFERSVGVCELSCRFVHYDHHAAARDFSRVSFLFYLTCFDFSHFDFWAIFVHLFDIFVTFFLSFLSLIFIWSFVCKRRDRICRSGKKGSNNPSFFFGLVSYGREFACMEGEVGR